MLAPFLEVGLRLFFCVFLLAATMHKLFSSREFESTVRAYFRPFLSLPAALYRGVAWAVIVLEASVALAALVAPGPLAALVVASLLLVYAVAMACNLLVGNRRLDCGCSWVSQPVHWSLVARNAALASLAGLLLLVQADRVVDGYSVINGIGLFLAALCGYGLSGQLLHNHSLQERESL